MCGNLKKNVKSLENQILKDKQYNCCNCIEFACIPNTISDDKLEESIVEICKDICISISEMDIEACHRLPVRYNAAGIGKRVIIRFVNFKHAESSLSKEVYP